MIYKNKTADEAPKIEQGKIHFNYFGGGGEYIPELLDKANKLEKMLSDKKAKVAPFFMKYLVNVMAQTYNVPTALYAIDNLIEVAEEHPEIAKEYLLDAYGDPKDNETLNYLALYGSVLLLARKGIKTGIFKYL